LYQQLIHMAATHGHDVVAELLLRRGADPNSKAEQQWSALHMTACYNHADVATLLLKAGAIVDAPRSDGATPLHIAARKGNAEVAEVLLRAGASVDAVTTRGHTPLVAAVQFGHTEVVALLRNPPPPSGPPRAPAPLVDAAAVSSEPASESTAPPASAARAASPGASAASSVGATVPRTSGATRRRTDAEVSLVDDASAPRLVRAATEDGAGDADDAADGVASMGPEEVAEALTAFVCRGLPGPTKLAYRAAVRAATAENDVTGSAIVYEANPEELARTLLEGYKKGSLPRGSLGLTVRFIMEAQQAEDAAPRRGSTAVASSARAGRAGGRSR